MGTLTSLASQLLVCLTGLAICVATQLQALAGGGDIIISRDVQPRAATRQELVPDPNPQLVNPNNDPLINRAVRGGQAPMELSDRDFAGVNTGTSLASGVQIFAQPVDQPAGNHLPGRAGLGVTGSSSVGGATGAANRVGSDVNRSVQQGLRPLQNLGK